METAFFVLLLLVVWISLHNHIGKAIANIESLKKETASLRKQLEGREIVAEEECHIPICILILVIGMGLFVKYAIDKNWINEVLRTVLGFVVGGGLLLISQKLEKIYRAFSSLLAGGAFAIFYVTVAMAYHYYGLFSQATAFVILVVLTILMFVLSLYKKWGELPIVSFVASYLILFGYSSAGDLDVAGFTQLTLGKIIIFIILGVILLVLSFLYQKLKKVLFEEDREELANN